MRSASSSVVMPSCSAANFRASAAAAFTCRNLNFLEMPSTIRRASGFGFKASACTASAAMAPLECCGQSLIWCWSFLMISVPPWMDAAQSTQRFFASAPRASHLSNSSLTQTARSASFSSAARAAASLLTPQVGMEE